MFFGGIDVHKEYLIIAVVDNDGNLVREEGQVPSGDGNALLSALEKLRPLEVVVETCSFWPWIADTLEPTEIEFHLAHANKLEAIAQAETKTDSVDAELLARMLATDLIPEVYPKPVSQRETCRLVRHREALVEERSSLCSRIHSHLHQQGLQLGRDKLLTDAGRSWLREEAWPWHLVYLLDHALWNDGIDYRRRIRLRGELQDRVFRAGDGRDRRAEIRAWAVDRLGPHERGRSLVTSATGEVCYERPLSLRTARHAERELRELNRRTDVGARWTVRGVRNLLRLRLARRCPPDDYARLWKNHDSSLKVEARSPGASVSTH